MDLIIPANGSVIFLGSGDSIVVNFLGKGKESLKNAVLLISTSENLTEQVGNPVKININEVTSVRLSEGSYFWKIRSEFGDSPVNSFSVKKNPQKNLLCIPKKQSPTVCENNHVTQLLSSQDKAGVDNSTDSSLGIESFGSYSSSQFRSDAFSGIGVGMSGVFYQQSGFKEESGRLPIGLLLSSCLSKSKSRQCVNFRYNYDYNLSIPRNIHGEFESLLRLDNDFFAGAGIGVGQFAVSSLFSGASTLVSPTVSGMLSLEFDYRITGVMFNSRLSASYNYGFGVIVHNSLQIRLDFVLFSL